MAENKIGNEDPTRRVQIRLFRDNGRYRDPLYVAVNEYSASIPRGVSVDVPYYVAKHIEEMQMQDDNTAAMITTLGNEFEKNSQALS